jgi:hypothetical protein
MTLLLFLTACPPPILTDSDPMDCSVVVDGGDDLTVGLNAEIQLDASATAHADERCEGELSFHWDVASPPDGSTGGSFEPNDSADAVVTTFSPDMPGTWLLSVEAGDGVNSGEPANVVVEVLAPPVADAGADAQGVVGARVDLMGSGTGDGTLSYAWALTSTPGCSSLGEGDLEDNTSATAGLVADCEGAYTAALTVTGDAGPSTPDAVDITIDPATQAVADGTFSGNCVSVPVELDASDSTSGDGSALRYEWFLFSAPAGSTATAADFSAPTSVTTTFAWDAVGEYRFKLVVHDDTSTSAPDFIDVNGGDC